MRPDRRLERHMLLVRRIAQRDVEIAAIGEAQTHLSNAAIAIEETRRFGVAIDDPQAGQTTFP